MAQTSVPLGPGSAAHRQAALHRVRDTRSAPNCGDGFRARAEPVIGPRFAEPLARPGMTVPTQLLQRRDQFGRVLIKHLAVFLAVAGASSGVPVWRAASHAHAGETPPVRRRVR